MQKWNKEFDVEDIGTNCFYIVLVDSVCDDNISDCLNNDGQLVYEESDMISADCSLAFNNVNSEVSIISLDGSVTFTFGEGETFDMKGIFITNDAGYVLGYTINPSTVTISNQMIFEDGLIFWDIVEGGS